MTAADDYDLVADTLEMYRFVCELARSGHAGARHFLGNWHGLMPGETSARRDLLAAQLRGTTGGTTPTEETTR